MAPFGSVNDIALEEDEKRLWKAAVEEQARLDRSARIFNNSILNEYVNGVGQRLIPQPLHMPGLSFRFEVIKHPFVNAFSYPNGAVYIHTGLLAKMDNEAQLATVLAHEIAHVIHRHTLQSMRHARSSVAFLTTLQVIGAPGGLPGLGAIILGGIGTMAAISGYSQAAEEEADRQGFAQILRAGYDAKESVKLFDSLKKDLEERNIQEPFFFGSHPRLHERQESYRQLVSKLPLDQSGETGNERFIQKILPALLENAQLDLAMGRFEFALEALKKFLRYEPNSPGGYYWLGESYRQRNHDGDSKLAEQHYLSAVHHDENYANSYRGLGAVYMKQGDRQRAAAFYSKYLSLFPQAEDRAYVELYLREMQDQGEKQ